MQVSIDMDTVKLIASAAAESAAKTMAQEVRDEVRRELAGMEDRLKSHIDSYFGRLDATDHIVQHNRIERLLSGIDGIGTKILATVSKFLITGLIVSAVLGYAISNNKLGWLTGVADK